MTADAEYDEGHAGAGSREETVLVVEDDADVRAYSCETLAELGYAILSAESGEAGLHLLDAHPDIRVLFTDTGLPGGMNGRQLSDEACKRRPDLKVVPSLLGRVVVKRFQNFSIDPALMSVAGSALLFGIGTLALP